MALYPFKVTNIAYMMKLVAENRQRRYERKLQYINAFNAKPGSVISTTCGLTIQVTDELMAAARKFQERTS